MVKCHGPGVGFADEILREKKREMKKIALVPIDLSRSKEKCLNMILVPSGTSNARRMGK